MRIALGLRLKTRPAQLKCQGNEHTVNYRQALNRLNQMSLGARSTASMISTARTNASSLKRGAITCIEQGAPFTSIAQSAISISSATSSPSSAATYLGGLTRWQPVGLEVNGFVRLEKRHCTRGELDGGQ